MTQTNQHPLDQNIASREERVGYLEHSIRKMNQELIVVRAELQAYRDAKSLTPINNNEQQSDSAADTGAPKVRELQCVKSTIHNQEPTRSLWYGGGHAKTLDVKVSESVGPVSWHDVFRKLYANRVRVFGYDELVHAAEILGHTDVKKSSCRATILDYVNKGWLDREKPGRFQIAELGKAELGLTSFALHIGEHASRAAEPSRTETGGAGGTSPLPNLNPSPSVGEQE
tara:strand:- start:684 stop:1367 length:684 start_codon:yes stop_codon:yes gene_type:complete